MTFRDAEPAPAADARGGAIGAATTWRMLPRHPAFTAARGLQRLHRPREDPRRPGRGFDGRIRNGTGTDANRGPGPPGTYGIARGEAALRLERRRLLRPPQRAGRRPRARRAVRRPVQGPLGLPAAQ